MSTSELFIFEEEILPFVEDTTDSVNLITFGPDDKDVGICPFISFYVYHSEEDYLDLAQQYIEIYHKFEKLIDEPFKILWKAKTKKWLKNGDKRLPDDLFTVAEELKKDCRPYRLYATDRKSEISSPRWSFNAVVDNLSVMSYSTLKIVFRDKWYQQNQQTWHQFVHDCIERLNPIQCYSGYGVTTGDFSIMGSYEVATMQRICADYYYGADIDATEAMSGQYHDRDDDYVGVGSLGGGLRTPTWSFLLSPYWLDQLGKTEAEVREELSDSQITITTFPQPKSKLNPRAENALWIQLGDLALYPVGQGKPDLLVKANRLIKPIRCDQLVLNELGTWAGDPNPRFTTESAIRWMQRFDDNQNWLEHRCPNLPLPQGVYEAKPGETVPKGGVWYAPNLPEGGERYLETGQQLPYDKTNEDGDEVIWYRKLDVES